MRRSRVLAWATLVLFVTPLAGPAQQLTLDDAVGAALGSHPALLAATARVDAADGAGDAARATRLPGAAVSTSLTRFQEPMIVAPFHSLDFTNPPVFDRTLVQGRLGMEYTVFDGGERSSRIRGADATSEATRYGRSATEMDLVERTAAAYVGVLAARAVGAAAHAQTAALEAEHARALQRHESGSAAELEVLRAAAALQEARAEEASALARIGLAERTLARTMGVEPSRVTGRPLADVSASAMPALSEGAASPLVLRADGFASAAEARVAEAAAARLPTVRAAAGVLDFGTVSGNHVLEWQAGVEVSWPVFTGGARGAAIRRAEADLRAARGDLEAARLNVAHAIDAARTAVVEADARAEALALAVAQWEEVARIEALALEAGSGVQRDLLRAQAGLFGARAGQSGARYDAVLARVALARAAGLLDADWIDETLEVAP